MNLEWVVKAAKICNLRCQYCYLWDELDDPRRISLDHWRKIFTEIKSYNSLIQEKRGTEARNVLIWHGGEPLLLPDDYIEAILDLQDDVFGANAVERGEIVNCVQTNLFALTPRKLGLLKRGQFLVGVSFDLASGVRVDRKGRETEERVVENMERLRAANIRFGAITVLAAHNRDYLSMVHDFFADIHVSFRVLPLHAAPLNLPDAPFSLTKQDAVDGLCELFVHWLNDGCRIRVDPLSDYLQVVLLRMCGLTRPAWSRRSHGDNVLIVNTDGNLFVYEEAYLFKKSEVLGNLFNQDIAGILESDKYERSLGRSELRAAQHCEGCEFKGPCNSSPLYHVCDLEPTDEHCGIAHATQRFIEDHLIEIGLDEAECATLLNKTEPLAISAFTS